MDELFVVFRRDNHTAVTETVGEFLTPSANVACLEAQQRFSMRDWWDYWAVPAAWFHEARLEGLLSNALC